MNITITARRDYMEEPVFVPVELPGKMEIHSASISSGVEFPAQCVNDGVVVLATMKRGETIELTLAEKSVVPDIMFNIEENKKSLDVYLGNTYFTSFKYDPSYKKPFLGPVMAKDEISFTRLDFETKEHPHQRSVFVGVGDVNGIDFWNEDKNFGYQVHQGFENIYTGASCAGFTANIIWCNSEQKPMMDEKRTYTFYNQGYACRYIDLKITFTASYGNVEFGATKEAGPLGVRMNEALRADRDGSFVNSYGGEKEEECWGKCASWCDYHGVIDDRLYGIAVFDNEKNERYPTTWHIRNYGLFAANNLYFKGGLIIPNKDSLTYRYRSCFYEGKQINTADRFVVYAMSKSNE
jgi:hypothetical protein